MSETSQANCPKCGHKRQPSTPACPRCGLQFALWKSNLADRRTQLTPQAQELWNGVETNWQENSLHEAFAKHCLQANLLPAAGRCYRDRLVRFPGDPIATKMQAEILAKATLGLMVQQQRRTTTEPVTRSKWFWFIMVAAMALAIVGAFIWGSGKKSPPSHRTKITLPGPQ